MKERLTKQVQTVTDQAVAARLFKTQKAANVAQQVAVEAIGEREALLEQLREAQAEIANLGAQLTRALARLEEQANAVFVGDLD